MSADDVSQFLTNALYVLIFVVVAARALRRPLRASVDSALFFGVIALIIAISWINQALDIEPGRWQAALTGAVLMALPYLFLRLVYDFSDVSALVMRVAEAGLGFSIVSLLVFSPLPAGLVLALVIYFAVFSVYGAAAFMRESRRSSGVTRRRMQAVAVGSVMLGAVLLVAGFQALWPGQADLWRLISRALALASGIAYFLGFATPGWLRRTWQEPELRAFLGRAARLPRLPDTASIVRELERGAAASLGAPYAAIGLWDGEAQVLRFGYRAPLGRGGRRPVPDVTGSTTHSEEGDLFDVRPGEMIAGRVFAAQEAIFSANAMRDDPANADAYRAAGAAAVLAAPITAGDRRLGALVVYAPRAPIFAEDDLVLVQLLADQAAVILESRALIDEAARVQAREEATRLKDDFLSAAAHDLKTPLTALIAQAQLLERRALRRPDAPPDLEGIQRIVRASKRLQRLVLELLDASRVEEGRLVGARETVDLVELAGDACARNLSGQHGCTVEAEGPVVGEYDPVRIAQLLENLIENAVKYSPEGGEVRVRVWREGDTAHLTVTDQGIGIPPGDLPHIFDRFHRGANVNDRTFAGMGLGLFICRGIAEQHGGRIWASSAAGRGSTFHVALPLVAVAPATEGAA